jgi:hypothetical protein
MEGGRLSQSKNPYPQSAPGAKAAVGHVLDNGIPLSIFPISASKLLICICGLPARGKTHISRRVARYKIDIAIFILHHQRS